MRETKALEIPVLSKNQALAAQNRERFGRLGLGVLTVVSSPGAGKTALLARTLSDLGRTLRAGVIVGDLATDNDARRLRASGAPAIQVQTGTVCHLDASMVARAADQLDLEHMDLLIIENVGNLVCPAAYDLGEDCRVVLLSVTEGEDKPLKYPTMSRTADLVVLTKMDLALATGFDMAAVRANLWDVCPRAQILEVSARSGVGLDDWYERLRANVRVTVPFRQDPVAAP